MPKLGTLLRNGTQFLRRGYQIFPNNSPSINQIYDILHALIDNRWEFTLRTSIIDHLKYTLATDFIFTTRRLKKAYKVLDQEGRA